MSTRSRAGSIWSFSAGTWIVLRDHRETARLDLSMAVVCARWRAYARKFGLDINDPPVGLALFLSAMGIGADEIYTGRTRRQMKPRRPNPDVLVAGARRYFATD